MIRKRKLFGLAVVAILAFGALGASSASAAKFTASSYPATLTGAQVEGQKWELGWSAFLLTCESVHFDGTGSIKEAQTTVEATPTFESCTATNFEFGNKVATLTPNGCAFKFHAEKESGGGDTYTGYIDLVCPEGKAIVYHLYDNAEKHSKNEAVCTYNLEPQRLTGVTFKNMTPTGITAELNSKIQTKKISGTLLVCGPENQEGKFTGNTTLEFLNEKGAMLEGHLG